MKNDLSRLNEHYAHLPSEIRRKGIISFAPKPPQEGNFLVSSIWDQMSPQWRNCRKTRTAIDSPKIVNLIRELKQDSEAGESPPGQIDAYATEARITSLKRMVRRKKGSWFQICKDDVGGSE
jgi:hypothetical protein